MLRFNGMKYAFKIKAVSSHFEKRFGHKNQKRFRHSGFVTLHSKFGYMLTTKPNIKMGNFCAVFTNILFHYTPHLANNE